MDKTFEEKLIEAGKVIGKEFDLAGSLHSFNELFLNISGLKESIRMSQKALRETEKQIKDSEASVNEGVLADSTLKNAEQRKNALALELKENTFYQELLTLKSVQTEQIAVAEKSLELELHRYKATGYSIEAAIAIIKALA